MGERRVSSEGLSGSTKESYVQQLRYLKPCTDHRKQLTEVEKPVQIFKPNIGLM